MLATQPEDRNRTGIGEWLGCASPTSSRRAGAADRSEPVARGTFHALADPTRRAMVRNLARRERTVGELAAPFEMTLAAASKHVRTLERAGLVRRTVRGRTHTCRLDPKPLLAAQQWIADSER